MTSMAALRGYGDYYATAARIAIAEQFQYRVANYFWMIGILAEPVIYLAVWTTIAAEQGGQVGGLSAGQLSAYYIVWTLVRNFNIVNIGAWDYRVRTGELSPMLLRPIHPFHWDLGYFAGWKFVLIALWLPIAFALSILFPPELNIRPIDVGVFVVALWGAYVVRSLTFVLVGIMAIFTTRIWPIIQVVFTLELLFSGRLVPLSLMPQWAQALADLLPFKWTFGFPIEALIGRLPGTDLLLGLVAQATWIAIGFVALRLLWPVAVRHYSAVSG